MPKKRKETSEVSAESRAKIQEGGRRGAERVRQVFSEKLTRRRFSEAVGIHTTTLRRWEQAGVVKPQFETVLGIRSAVFEESEVERARQIAALLRDNPGEMSLSRAMAIVDGD